MLPLAVAQGLTLAFPFGRPVRTVDTTMPSLSTGRDVKT